MTIQPNSKTTRYFFRSSKTIKSSVDNKELSGKQKSEAWLNKLADDAIVISDEEENRARRKNRKASTAETDKQPATKSDSQSELLPDLSPANNTGTHLILVLILQILLSYSWIIPDICTLPDGSYYGNNSFWKHQSGSVNFFFFKMDNKNVQNDIVSHARLIVLGTRL